MFTQTLLTAPATIFAASALAGLVVVAFAALPPRSIIDRTL